MGTFHYLQCMPFAFSSIKLEKIKHLWIVVVVCPNSCVIIHCLVPRRLRHKIINKDMINDTHYCLGVWYFFTKKLLPFIFHSEIWRAKKINVRHVSTTPLFCAKVLFSHVFSILFFYFRVYFETKHAFHVEQTPS